MKSIEEVLNSYSVPELRQIVKIHNKSVNEFIKDEIKMLRDKFKADKLIKITGIKDKNEIVKIMLEKEKHFVNIPFKVPVTEAEKNQYLADVVHPTIDKLTNDYIADKDKDEVEDGLKILFKEVKAKELNLPMTKSQIKNLIFSYVKPNRPKYPPMFKFVGGKLQLIKDLNKRPPKPSRPSKPPVLKVHKMPDGEVMVGKQHGDKSKPLITLDVEEKPNQKKQFSLDCSNAHTQARKIIKFYTENKGIFSKDKLLIENRVELNKKIETIKKMLNDPKCKDVKTNPPFIPYLEKALSLHLENKKKEPDVKPVINPKNKDLDLKRKILDLEQGNLNFKQFLKDFKTGKTKFGGKIKLEDYPKEKDKLKKLLDDNREFGREITSKEYLKNLSEYSKELSNKFISEYNKITRLYNRAKTRFNNLSYLNDYGGVEVEEKPDVKLTKKQIKDAEIKKSQDNFKQKKRKLNEEVLIEIKKTKNKDILTPLPITDPKLKKAYKKLYKSIEDPAVKKYKQILDDENFSTRAYRSEYNVLIRDLIRSVRKNPNFVIKYSSDEQSLEKPENSDKLLEKERIKLYDDMLKQIKEKKNKDVLLVYGDIKDPKLKKSYEKIYDSIYKPLEEKYRESLEEYGYSGDDSKQLGRDFRMFLRKVREDPNYIPKYK